MPLHVNEGEERWSRSRGREWKLGNNPNGRHSSAIFELALHCMVTVSIAFPMGML